MNKVNKRRSPLIILNENDESMLCAGISIEENQELLSNSKEKIPLIRYMLIRTSKHRSTGACVNNIEILSYCKRQGTSI